MKINNTVSPLFSVVVPVYNTQEYLPECIDSVLNQTFTDFELILVDDGSADSSGEICDCYAEKDSRVKTLHKENGGHTKARLDGVNIASGRYIVFLDSDDWLDGSLLERCADEIGERSPDMIVYGSIESYPDREVRVKQSLESGFYEDPMNDPRVSSLIFMDDSGRTFPRSLCEKAIKKEIVLSNLARVPSGIKTGEDMCAIVGCLTQTSSVSVLSGDYYYYRIIEGSMSRSADNTALANVAFLTDYLGDRFMTEGQEFRDQIYRLFVQQIYSAALRVVRSGASSGFINVEFKKLLLHKNVKTAINKAKFSSKSLKIKKIILKYRLFFLISPIDKRIH